MTRGILIIGNESALYQAICAEAAKRVEQYATSVFTANNANTTTDKAGNLLDWNPSSPLSARTLLIGAENILGKINETILVCSPSSLYGTAGDLSPAEIDKYINEQIKSWFFLVREITLYYKRQGSGKLAMTVPDTATGFEKTGKNRETQIDLLGCTAAASINVLAQSVLTGGAMVFSGLNPGAGGEFASWLFKILEEDNPKNNGKWHRFSKLSFFN